MLHLLKPPLNESGTTGLYNTAIGYLTPHVHFWYNIHIMIIIIPKDMHVPSTRRDTSKIENLRWLNRNLWIQNSKHPEFIAINSKITFALLCWPT